MKPEKLFPAEKRHVVDLPLKIDVNDVDIDGGTRVFAMLGFRSARNKASRPRHQELIGTTPERPFYEGKWRDIASNVEKLTPRTPGYYCLVISALVNVAGPSDSPRHERVIFRTLEVKVVPRRP